MRVWAGCRGLKDGRPGEWSVLSGRVAQFSLYERLFALWHILHLPIFFLMVLSAIVHVVAVHMY